MTAPESKREARGRIRARIAAYSPQENERIGRAMCGALLQSAWYRRAGTVFSFVSLPSEPDTRLLLARALADGKTLCVPLCRGGGVMEARAIASLADLRPGAMGIQEPDADAPRVGPESIDLCVVPCLAATAQGVRLGHGGGYYDRFLKQLSPRAARVLLCRRALVLERLPQDAWDVPVPLILTEEGFL